MVKENALTFKKSNLIDEGEYLELKYKVSLEVLHGKVALNTFQLRQHKVHTFKKTKSIGEGEIAAFKYKL